MSTKRMTKVQELESNPIYVETYKACLEHGVEAGEYVRLEFEHLTGKHCSVGTLYRWLATYHKDLYTPVTTYGRGKYVREGRTQVCRFVNKDGDVYIRTKDGWAKEYRALMQPELIGSDDDDIVVHHVNGDHFDNRPENLCTMTRSEHTSLHMTEYWDEKLGR